MPTENGYTITAVVEKWFIESCTRNHSAMDNLETKSPKKLNLFTGKFLLAHKFGSICI